MKAAGIIAAGEGSRLAPRSGGVVKPLVAVAGVSLAEWVARSLSACGVSEVTLLHNSRGGGVRATLRAAFPRLDWTFLQADTASSWESFRLVARSLAARHDSFLISTVDAIVPPAELARFAAEMERRGPAAGLALTDFIDDEKPLWADLDGEGRVTALGERATRRRLATAGVYYLSRPAVEALPQAESFSRLRDFWAALVAQGLPVAGVALGKTVDVDRPEDVRAAEAFLRSAPW